MNACLYLYIIIPLLYLTFNYQSTFSENFSTDSLTKFSLLKLTASLGNTGSNSNDSDSEEEGPPSFVPPPPPGKKGASGSSPDGRPVPLPRTRHLGGNPPKGLGKPPVPTPRLRDLDGTDGGRKPSCPLGRRGGVRGRDNGPKKDPSQSSDSSSSSSSSSSSNSSPDGPVSSSGDGSSGKIIVKKPLGGPPKPPTRSSSLSSLLD